METFFGKIVECDAVRRNTLFIVPPVELQRVFDPTGNLIVERLVYDKKAAAVITGIAEKEN